MGVYWNSKAEVITENNSNSKKILNYIKKNSKIISDNTPINDIDIKDSSIIFSSLGYGYYYTLFDNILNNFQFPIFCHERVLPSQGQGYGFFYLASREKENKTPFSHQENWYIDPENKPDSEWVDSVQILSIPKSWESITELKKIIQNAKNNGTPIQSSFHEDLQDVFYWNDFLNNCIPKDEQSVNDFFENELKNLCTWDSNIGLINCKHEDDWYAPSWVSDSKRL